MQGHMCPDCIVFEKKLKVPSHTIGWSRRYFIPNPIDMTANSIHIFFRVLGNFAFTLPIWIHIVFPENLQRSEQGKNPTSVLTEVCFLFDFVLGRYKFKNTCVKWNAIIPQIQSSVHLLWGGFCYQIQELPHSTVEPGMNPGRLKQNFPELEWSAEISLHSDKSKKTWPHMLPEFSSQALLWIYSIQGHYFFK